MLSVEAAVLEREADHGNTGVCVCVCACVCWMDFDQEKHN